MEVRVEQRSEDWLGSTQRCFSEEHFRHVESCWGRAAEMQAAEMSVCVSVGK